MKKIYSNLITITIISIMVISCSSKKDSYTNAIPSDASVVLSIKAMEIWNKSGFNEQQYQEFIKNIQQTITNKMDTPNAMLEVLINDPTQSGIDLKENIYFYTPQTIGKSIYFVAKVSSFDNLYNTLENLPTGDRKVSFTKHGEATVATLDNQLKCAFDNNTIVIVASKEEISSDSLAIQIKGFEKGGINANPAFEQMNKDNSDIASMVSSDKVQKYMLEEMVTYSMLNQITTMGQIQVYKDMYLILNLCFEDGRLHFTNEYFTKNKETQEQLDNYMTMMGEIGNTFTSKFSSDVMAFFGMNINGEKVMDEALKMKPDLMKGINEPNAQKYINAIKSIDGDIVFGLGDVYTTKSMALYAQVKDNSILNLITEYPKILGFKLTKISDNEYTYSINPYKITIGHKDNQLYAIMGNSNETKITNPLSASQWASTISGSSSYILINIESTMTKLDPLIKEFSNYDKFTKQSIELLSNLSYAESYYDNSKNQFIVNICTKDTKTNILKTFAKYLPEMKIN